MDVKRQGKGRTWVFLLISVIVLVLLDQGTKILAASNLKDHSLVLIPGVLQLTYLENRGAAFSMLEGQQGFFYVITIVIVAAVLWFYAKLPTDRKYRKLRVTLAFLTAGALGNFIDRIALHYVRDFIYFVLINFPIFNVADIYVTGSAIALVVFMLFAYKDDDFAFLKKNKSKAD